MNDDQQTPQKTSRRSFIKTAATIAGAGLAGGLGGCGQPREKVQPEPTAAAPSPLPSQSSWAPAEPLRCLLFTAASLPPSSTSCAWPTSAPAASAATPGEDRQARRAVPVLSATWTPARMAKAAEAVPRRPAVPGLPRDARQGAQEHRRRHDRHAGPSSLPGDDAGDAARQARLHAEAADAHGLGGAAADAGGREVQGRHADGQPGPRAAKAGGWSTSGSTAARSATSTRCTPGPIVRSGRRAWTGPDSEDAVPADAGLGRAGSARRPCSARSHDNGAYHPFVWRGWWDFGCGALGDMACHTMDGIFWRARTRLSDRGRADRGHAESPARRLPEVVS